MNAKLRLHLSGADGNLSPLGSGRSVVWLARLFRVQEVVRSNRTAPTILFMKKSLGAKTLVFPTPVFVVGTYDPEGRPNVMVASWGGLCCSVPPCVAVSLRKVTYSHASILHQRAFTLSIPSQDQIQKVDFLGMVSGRTEDKFKRAKLTPVKGDHVNAPYVREFPLALECRVIHVIEIGLHTQFVGEILDVKAEENILRPDGLIEIEQAKPVLFEPDTHRYFGTGACLGNAFALGQEIMRE
jgi:flavin reductase (DIM6/NTAB) family NADH-FMN oxidoreductase RutF